MKPFFADYHLCSKINGLRLNQNLPAAIREIPQSNQENLARMSRSPGLLGHTSRQGRSSGDTSWVCLEGFYHPGFCFSWQNLEGNPYASSPSQREEQERAMLVLDVSRPTLLTLWHAPILRRMPMWEGLPLMGQQVFWPHKGLNLASQSQVCYKLVIN